MSSITFIGQPKATGEAQAALNFLGRVLATNDVDVALIPKGESNTALMAGYNAKAESIPRAPIWDVDKDLLEVPTDQTIVFANEALLRSLDKADPNWRRPRDIVLTSDEQLARFLDLLLALHKENTGEVIEPF